MPLLLSDNSQLCVGKQKRTSKFDFMGLASF
jgi:hypothetical protein